MIEDDLGVMEDDLGMMEDDLGVMEDDLGMMEDDLGSIRTVLHRFAQIRTDSHSFKQSLIQVIFNLSKQILIYSSPMSEELTKPV